MVRVYTGTQAIANGLAGLIEVLKEKYFLNLGQSGWKKRHVMNI